jgi:hypothetical protein
MKRTKGRTRLMAPFIARCPEGRCDTKPPVFKTSPPWRVIQGISEMASDREQRWRLPARKARGGFESHPISLDAGSGAISDVQQGLCLSSRYLSGQNRAHPDAILHSRAASVWRRCRVAPAEPIANGRSGLERVCNR